MGNILIVEDMLENLRLLTQLLKKHGYKTYSVETGQAALDFVAKHTPDLILLDIVLPDIDGFEVCSRVKNDASSKAIPVIFISALTRTEDILHGFAVGGVDYVTKPFIAEEVLARVATHMEMSGMRNQLVKQSTELQQMNLEIQRQGKAEIRAKMNELQQLAHATSVLLEIDSKEAIYDYIEEFVYPLSGADYLMIAGYDELSQTTYAQKIFGIASFVKGIISILGNDFMHSRVSTNDWVSRLSLAERKNLYKLEDGLYELTEHTISKTVCLGIEKLMGIEEMFAIGFISYDKYYGGISFGFKKGNIFNNKNLVESILYQISLAISRLDAKEKLKLSEEKYRSIFDHTGNATMIVDDKANIILVNNKCAGLTGYSPQQLIGKRWTQFVAPDSLEGLKRFSLKRRDDLSEIDETYEANLVGAKGQKLIVKISVGLIPESNNSVVSMLDITDLKYAQKEVVKNEQKYRSIFENIQDVYFETKLDGTIIELSPSIQLLSKNQYKRKDLLGKSLYDFYQSNNGPSAILSRLKNGERVHDYEINLINKNGSLLICSLSANIHLDPIGKFPKIVGTFHDITDRKKAQDKILKLSQAMEQSPVSILITNTDGKIEYCNPKTIEVTGYSLDELIGENPKIFSSGEKTNAEYKALWDTISSGKEWKGEFLNQKKNGEHYWERASISPILNENGKITHFLGVKEDITERKNTEDNLLLFRTLLDHANDAIEIIDPESGRFLDVNEKGYLDLGYSKEEYLNLKVFDIDPKVNPDLFKKIIGDLRINNSLIWIGEHLRKDGTIFPVEVNIKLITTNKEYLLSVVRDISMRKRLEGTQEILVNISNALLATESLHDFSNYIFNELGKVIKTNNFYIALYQEENQMFSAPFIKDSLDADLTEFPVGKTMTGLVIRTRKSQLIDKERFKSLEQAGEIELLGPPSDVWIGVPLFINENVIGAIVIQNYEGEKRLDEEDLKILEYAAPQISLAIDRKRTLEDLKAALEKAQESDRLKSAFLANMSHEIRTPMNGILGFTELLKEPQLSGEQQQEFIEIIERSGARMLNTIRDLIDISTIEAGQVTVMNSETDMKELLHQIETFFKPEIDSKSLQLHFNLPAGERTTCYTDSEKVYAILSNLTKNAIKYSKKGKIEIGCDKNQECLAFYVKDQGIGIPKDKLESVFDRFVQADSRLSSDYEGVGLGLSITKAYVEMLGGKIWVESEEGVGSTFYFTIAKKDEQGLEIKKTVLEAKTTDKITIKTSEIKLKILLVEDDPMSQQLIKHMLSGMYDEMIIANNGIEALDYAKAISDIDLILMDMKMPDMDGFEATRLIRQFNKEVIIIAQTAYSMMGDREKTIEAGCSDYISKPINKTELIKLLNKYFKH